MLLMMRLVMELVMRLMMGLVVGLMVRLVVGLVMDLVMRLVVLHMWYGLVGRTSCTRTGSVFCKYIKIHHFYRFQWLRLICKVQYRGYRLAALFTMISFTAISTRF